MYSPELIATIFAELEAAAGETKVLLCGSYLYNEATPQSDLDFTIVAPFWKLAAKQFRNNVKSVKVMHPGIDVRTLLVPTFMFNRGWYYIYGRDSGGVLHVSGINKQIIIRNCLKKALYRLCKNKIYGQNAEERPEIAKQLAAAAYLLKNSNPTASFFSKKFLTDHEPEILNTPIESLETKALELYRTPGLLNFSLVNYLLYNFVFLKARKTLFLFKNPDKMIARSLVSVLRNPAQTELFETAKNLTFPVIIF